MDPYEVLGIDRNADDNTIKKAYYKLAKEYHPDRTGGDPKKGERFKSISTAYSMLTDKSFLGGTGFSGFSGYNSNAKFDFKNFEGLNIPNLLSNVRDKFFSEAKLFTKFFNEKNGKSRKRDESLDILVNLKVDLYDIYFGTIRKVKLNIRKKCRECMALGVKVNEGGTIDTCINCNGLKTIESQQEFNVDTSEKKVSFFRKGHESVSSPPGDIHFLIHPKIDKKTIGFPEEYRVMTVNFYDLLIQVPKETSNITSEITLFNSVILKLEPEFETHISNMGLIRDTIDNRGSVTIQQAL